MNQARNEKHRKKLAELEAQLVLASPNLPFRISKRAGPVHTFLLTSEYERDQWGEAIQVLQVRWMTIMMEAHLPISDFWGGDIFRTMFEHLYFSHWLAFTGFGYVSFRSQVEQDISPKVPFATEGNTSHRISPSTLPSGNKGPYFLSLSIHFMLREHYFIGLQLLPCMMDFAEMCLQSQWFLDNQEMQFH